ncbi:hypothetical protein [Streptomyces sp. 4F14]|uniref:hypothetical protein n=1 Tax=Streptomyces sp. 4F14 TaxID=3394380 RepID=UPI003A85E508
MSGADQRYDEITVGVLLDAGAVLPAGSTAREDADTLTARTYTHPALDDRRVVRLVPGTLGEAEDLALDFLGLVREPDAPEVGQVRRETLGFPAWALVNDPANGHHALALVRDVERLARQAKSRPGTAKEGFEELGGRLGRAVPHFLPTFYEQAARVFLQHENTTYAAAFFGKARDAERVHALTVDEERQRAVFLEFAFAGALTVKALKEHVKALAARLTPVDAWAQFRQLTVERCAAGMPPYASLPQDARGLVKAAGLDRVAEEGSLVADLLASPAAVRAPASFWNAYRATLVVLAKERPGVRARLLEIMPAGLGREVEDDESWLALLAECGADRLLVEGDGVDPADWLTRWALYRKHGSSSSRRSPATLALVARMAPRLRELARPVDLFSGRWYPGADPDLLDLCAAEGVPLALPGADTNVHLGLDDWFKDEREGRRDLTALAADPALRRRLYQSIEALGRGRSTENAEALAAHPVLREVLREWLEDAAGELTRAAGLPGARAAVGRLQTYRSVAGRVAPDAVARAAAYEVAPVLGRALRAGILDELGWPALDEALGLLDTGRAPDNSDPLRVHEAWPALILSRRHKAVVVGPEGVLLEHDLRIPVALQQWEQPSFRYADGELLVVWRTEGRQSGYWSARPTEVFTAGGEQLSGWYGNDADTPSVPLPGGGRATGGRTLHAGDTVVPPSRPVIADGSTLWRLGRDGTRQVWLEYDPATGSHGRASLPAFLRAGILEGATLRQDDCSVLPLQPGLEESPFGTDGTVLGRWVRADDEGRLTVGTPDGRTLVLDGHHRRCVPLGALRLPGGAAPVAVASDRQIVLYAGDDTSSGGELGRVTRLEPGREFAAGTGLVPPVDFWHALRPRDTVASAVLRELDDTRAAELLAVGARALEERQARVSAAEGDEKAAIPGAEEVVREAVGQVLTGFEPRLLAGVAGVVRAMLELAVSVGKFVTPPEPAARASRSLGMFADLAPEHGDDQSLREAVAGITHLRQIGWYRDERRWGTLRQLKAVHHVLAGRPADGPALARRAREDTDRDGWLSDEFTVPGIETGWPALLGVLRPLAYRAASPLLAEERRRALLLLFDTLLEGPLVHSGTWWREVRLSESFERKHGTRARAGQVLRRGERTVVILGCENTDNEHERVRWLALDHDPSGRFDAVAHFTRETEYAYPADLSAGALADVVRLVREKGPAPWLPEAPAALVAATGGGLGPAQAAVLLAARPHDPSTEQLAEIGLKPRQSEQAGVLLNTLGAETWRPLVGLLLPEAPADLWTSGPDTAAVGGAWRESLHGLVRLPEDLAAELDRANMSLSGAVDILNPGRTPWIARTTVQRPDERGNLVADDPAAMPSGRGLRDAVAALAHLAYALPYGHPLRAALPDSLAALRRRIADPGLLMDLDVAWAEKGGPSAVALRKAYGLPATGGAGADGLVRVGEVFALRPWYGDQETVLVAPGALSGADDPAFGLAEGIVGAGRGTAMQAVRTLLGEELARAVEAGTGAAGPLAGSVGATAAGETAGTAVEFVGFAQDPSVSVPALVGEVAEVCGLSEDAAVLYLQLLALPDPTDRDCARWTGWKPARLKKARTELAASDLVVTAKRARAGRTLFLPCGWSDLKAPALPLETWKEALYPLRDHGRVVPSVPVPELFARAWQRVRDGDGPAFEKLRTSRGRRRRA